MERIERYQTHRKKQQLIILIFFIRDYGYKCIGLITAISKHDIWNRKLITFDCLRWPNLEEIVWVEKENLMKILLRAGMILPYKYVK